jgi:hypothetical protein
MMSKNIYSGYQPNHQVFALNDNNKGIARSRPTTHEGASPSLTRGNAEGNV